MKVREKQRFCEEREPREPDSKSTQQLERLKRDAIQGLDRYFAAVNDSILSRQPPLTTRSAETTTVDFVKELMTDVLKSDLEVQKLLAEAGWRTIHGFYLYCDKAYPGWACKDTFYNRIGACLPYLLSEKIAERRPAKRRHGVGRAKYEYRINPDRVS